MDNRKKEERNPHPIDFERGNLWITMCIAVDESETQSISLFANHAREQFSRVAPAVLSREVKILNEWPLARAILN